MNEDGPRSPDSSSIPETLARLRTEPSVPVENRAHLDDLGFAFLTRALAWQGSIKNAVDWLAAHNPPLGPTEIVTQDEYSHDILAAYPGGLWLSYSCT